MSTGNCFVRRGSGHLWCFFYNILGLYKHRWPIQRLEYRTRIKKKKKLRSDIQKLLKACHLVYSITENMAKESTKLFAEDLDPNEYFGCRYIQSHKEMKLKSSISP